MPIYEYECTQCHTRFELKQAWSDEPIQTCPDCAGTVRRVYYPVGIVFKGSGFYITDNRKNGSARSEAGDGAAKDASAGKSDSTTSSSSTSGSTAEKKVAAT